MSTLTTGEVNGLLGFNLTPAFIKQMGVEPAELVKGREKWDNEGVVTLCAALCDHLYAVADQVKKGEIAPPSKKATSKPATVVDDDDEL
jgi:hypothetical protein